MKASFFFVQKLSRTRNVLSRILTCHSACCLGFLGRGMRQNFPRLFLCILLQGIARVFTPLHEKLLLFFRFGRIIQLSRKQTLFYISAEKTKLLIFLHITR